jgi:hypothetical protein
MQRNTEVRMPKSKHRKKPKAIPVKRTGYHSPLRVKTPDPVWAWSSGPVSADRLQMAEDLARCYAAEDPDELVLGANPPTDPRVIRCLRHISIHGDPW